MPLSRPKRIQWADGYVTLTDDSTERLTITVPKVVELFNRYDPWKGLIGVQASHTRNPVA